VCARRSAAFGVDSIQSILIALQKVKAEIYTSEVQKSRKLSWLERDDGYGFPLPAGIRYPYEGNGWLFVIDASWTFKLGRKRASKHRLLVAWREFRMLFRARPKAITPQVQNRAVAPIGTMFTFF
jgi:hypothetical protein